MDLELRPRLPNLTSLRFFAALYVFCFHLLALRIVTGPQLFRDFASIGYVGVSLFFVLSGFILVYTYEGRDVKAGEFWRARFARIYPAYAFSLLVNLPWFLGAVYRAHWQAVPWPVAHFKIGMALELLLLQGWVPPAAAMWNAVAWSLSVEAFFYLLFPYFLKWFARVSPARLMIMGLLCWLATLAVTGSYAALNPDGFSHISSDSAGFWLNVVKFNPLARLPEFLMGMVCGVYFLRRRTNPKLAVPLIGAGIFALGLAICFSAYIPFPMLHSGLLAPAFAAIIYGLALQPRFPAVLTTRPMVLLGEASYSFYLLHFFLILFCFFFVRTGFPRNAGGVLLCLVVTCVLSILAYLFLEVPARRKLRGERKPEVPATAAPPDLAPRPRTA
jgi:peptidoglycan/LPS O-acetylase OafA/YrhL